MDGCTVKQEFASDIWLEEWGQDTGMPSVLSYKFYVD